MTAYCQKYFNYDLTKDSIKSNIKDAEPVFNNAFFTSHTVDDFLEDSVEFYAMKFLKLHDESPAFILKKNT